MLNNQPYRVIGVMGPRFNWPNQVELWVPIALPPSQYHDENYRYNEYLFAMARLRPGVTLQQANAYLNMKAEQHIAVGRQQLQSTATLRRALVAPAAGACSPCR